MRITRALRVSLVDLFEPLPAKQKKQPCPVPTGGLCLQDLIEIRKSSENPLNPGHFSPFQIRRIRQFVRLVQKDRQALLKTLEIFLVDIGNGGRR